MPNRALNIPRVMELHRGGMRDADIGRALAIEQGRRAPYHAAVIGRAILRSGQREWDGRSNPARGIDQLPLRAGAGP